MPCCRPLHFGEVGGELAEAPLVVAKGGGANVDGALIGGAEQVTLGRVRLLIGFLGFGFVLFEGRLPACLKH
ncbi:MAG: hypothetical protein ACKV19_18140 [Verrucomicrobiales bacterium]